jgi:hypothetical protein
MLLIYGIGINSSPLESTNGPHTHPKKKEKKRKKRSQNVDTNFHYVAKKKTKEERKDT